MTQFCEECGCIDEGAHEHEFCEKCGDMLLDFYDGDDCSICGDGPFCDFCLTEHEEEEHSPTCRACGVKLEVNPPCPVCHREFCDWCIGGHMSLCQESEDVHLGIQRTLYSFMFEDGWK